MRDEDPIQALNHKVNVMSENLNLIQQFFMDKSVQNEQQKKLIDEEQKRIHEILRRWKMVEEEMPSVVQSTRSGAGAGPSATASVNNNGPTPTAFPMPPTSSASPPYNWNSRERSAPRSLVYMSPSGGSSPGRSPKARESHTSYRRQMSSTPSKQNSQYPILPKKRKIQQLVFSPTVSSASSSASVHTEPQLQAAPNKPDIATGMAGITPLEMILNIDPASLNMETARTPSEEVKLEAPGTPIEMDHQQHDCTSTGNYDNDTDSQMRTEELALNYSKDSEPEDLSSAKQPVPTSSVRAVNSIVHSTVLDTPSSETEGKSENEADSSPPKLSPAAGRNANSSPSPRRQPYPLQSQGSRKSSRTIRPSWKLNNSAENVLQISPERLPREERRDRDGGRDRSSSSTPSTKKKKKRPARPTDKVSSDEPPVLTSQLEDSLIKHELDVKPLTGGSVNKSLECHECHKVFATQHGLRYHIESHMQLKPYKCTICEKSFGQKSTLTRHEVTTHTKVKTHVCQLCRKSFSSQSELNSHRGRHEAKRNCCPVCNRGFIDKRYFKLHVKLCTAKNVEETNGDNEQGGSRGHALFQCSNCQKNYRDPNYFKKHVSLCMKE